MRLGFWAPSAGGAEGLGFLRFRGFGFRMFRALRDRARNFGTKVWSLCPCLSGSENRVYLLAPRAEIMLQSPEFESNYWIDVKELNLREQIVSIS